MIFDCEYFLNMNTRILHVNYSIVTVTCASWIALAVQMSVMN